MVYRTRMLCDKKAESQAFILQPSKRYESTFLRRDGIRRCNRKDAIKFEYATMCSQHSEKDDFNQSCLLK